MYYTQNAAVVAATQGKWVCKQICASPARLMLPGDYVKLVEWGETASFWGSEQCLTFPRETVSAIISFFCFIFPVYVLPQGVDKIAAVTPLKRLHWRELTSPYNC